MKNPRHRKLAALFFAFSCVVLTASAQTTAQTSEYSFTISASQPWIDTGVDLSASDTLAFTAERNPAPLTVAQLREQSPLLPKSFPSKTLPQEP